MSMLSSSNSSFVSRRAHVRWVQSRASRVRNLRRAAVAKADDETKDGGLFGVLSGTFSSKGKSGTQKVVAGKQQLPARGTQKVSRRGGTQRADAPRSGTQTLRRGTGLLGFGTQRLTGTLRLAARSRADPRTIFVAGATGRLGARIVRELLKAGYSVRAGVRSADKAQMYLEAARSYQLLSADELRRLQVVECDLEQGGIEDAIGNAGRVVCAIGAAENEFFNISAPQRIDGEATIALVDAAVKRDVKHFVLVTSLGTGKFGWPASILNLFWGVLSWKRRAEEALENSGMPYTIVRPGGMERPTDSHGETHALVLSARDTTFGGTVSRLQVAELVAGCFDNSASSVNKVLEVTASQAAERQPLSELLEEIPQDLTMEELDELKAQRAETAAALEAANEQLEDAETRKATLQEQRVLAENRLKELQQQFKAAQSASKQVLSEASGVESRIQALRSEADESAMQADISKALLDAARRVGREGRMLSRDERREIEQRIRNPPQAESEEQGNGVFGLFGTVSSRAKRAAETQAEEAAEAVEEAAPQPSGGFFGFGTRKIAAKPAQLVEEAAEAVEEAAPQPSGGLFGFGTRKISAKPAQVAETAEEAVVEAADAVREEGPRGLFGLIGISRRAAEQVTEEPEAAEPEPAAEPKPVAELQPARRKRGRGSIAQSRRAQPAAAENQAAESPQPVMAAAAESAAPTSNEASLAYAKEKRLAAEKAKQEDAERQARDAEKLRELQRVDAERRAAEAADLERRRAEIEARAKAQAEEEARLRKEQEEQAKAEAKARAEEAERQRVQREEQAAKARAAAEEQRAQREREQRDAELARQQEQTVQVIVKNKEEVQKWIAEWRQRTAAAPAEQQPAAAVTGAEEPSMSNGIRQAFVAGGDEPAMADNVRDAREWIANWRMRTRHLAQEAAVKEKAMVNA